MKTKKIVYLIVVSQILIITYLAYNINHQSFSTIKINNIKNRLFSKTQSINRKPGDPLKHFYEFIPNQKMTSEEEWLEKVVYTINSDTLNERFDYSPEKPENTFRIITLGDSFTMGKGVNTENNYSEILEEFLQNNCQNHTIQKYEVINLGVWGYDIEYAVKRFEKRGKKYQPDLVLWLLIHDDFTDTNEYKYPIHNQFFNQIKPSKSHKNYQKALKIIMKKYRITQPVNQAIKYNKQALSLFNKHYSGNLVFLTFPKLNKNYQTILQNFTKSRQNTFYLNYLPKLKQNTDLLLDNHPNEKGHKKIAESVFTYLTKNNLIPCNSY